MQNDVFVDSQFDFFSSDFKVFRNFHSYFLALRTLTFLDVPFAFRFTRVRTCTDCFAPINLVSYFYSIIDVGIIVNFLRCTVTTFYNLKLTFIN